MSQIEINGTKLEYAEQGTGQPLILVHPSLSDIRTWSAQMDPFGSKYRTVAYSRRYARPNPDIPDGVDDDMMLHVSDLVSLMNALDLAPAHLIGSSFGAYICLIAARNHPEMVRTLTICEPPLTPLYGLGAPPSPFQMLRLLFRSPMTFIAVVKMASKAFQPTIEAFKKGRDEEGWQTFAIGILGEERFKSVPEERKQQMRDNVKTLRAQLLGPPFPAFNETDARSIHAPTLLVTGEQSIAFFERVADRLEKCLPIVERAQIKGGSHLMYEDQPETFNRTVLDFLSRHGG